MEQYWESSKLTKQHLSALLLHFYEERPPVDSSPVRPSLSDYSLIFAFLSLIHHHHKIPTLIHDQGFLDCLAAVAMVARIQKTVGDQLCSREVCFLMEGQVEVEERNQRARNVKKDNKMYPQFFQTLLLNQKANKGMFQILQPAPMAYTYSQPCTLLKIPMDMLIALHREITNIFNTKIHTVLSEKTGLRQENLQKAGIAAKMKFMSKQRMQKLDGRGFGLFMVIQGEVLCEQESWGHCKFWISREEVLDCLWGDYELTAKTNTVVLALPRHDLKEFMQSFPKQAQKYRKNSQIRAHNIPKSSTLARLKENKTLYSFQNLSSPPCKRGVARRQEKSPSNSTRSKRFSRYNRKSEDDGEGKTFKEGDLEFVEVERFNKMIQSKERVLELKKSMEKDSKCDNIFEYLRRSEEMNEKSKKVMIARKYHIKEGRPLNIVEPAININIVQPKIDTTSPNINQDNAHQTEFLSLNISCPERLSNLSIEAQEPSLLKLSAQRKKSTKETEAKSPEIFLTADDTGLIHSSLVNSMSYRKKMKMLVERNSTNKSQRETHSSRREGKGKGKENAVDRNRLLRYSATSIVSQQDGQLELSSRTNQVGRGGFWRNGKGSKILSRNCRGKIVRKKV